MGRFISASQAPQPAPTTTQTETISAPQQPSTFGRFLPILGSAGSVINTGNRMFGLDPGAGSYTNVGLSGLGALTGFGGLAQGIATGNPLGASLGGLRGTGSLANIGSQLYAQGSNVGSALGIAPNAGLSSGLGAVGSGLGALGGLGGGIYAGLQGDAPGAVLGGLQGIGGLSSLVGSYLGASAPALAGAATAALPGGAAAAGAGSTAAAVGSGASALGAVLALSILGHQFLFEPGGRESLADRNKRRNTAGQTALTDSLLKGITRAAGVGGVQGFQQLLGAAGAGPKIGQGQVQFNHDKYGFGGDYDTPMSPEYAAALQRASQSEEGLRDFIRGIRVKTGHTGSTTDDFAVTDYYRRELAKAAGLTNVTGLFHTPPPRFTASGNLQELIGDLNAHGRGQWGDPALRPTVDKMVQDALAGKMSGYAPGVYAQAESYGPEITVPVSQAYRNPGEFNLTPAQQKELQDAMRFYNEITVLQEQQARDMKAL